MYPLFPFDSAFIKEGGKIFKSTSPHHLVLEGYSAEHPTTPTFPSFLFFSFYFNFNNNFFPSHSVIQFSACVYNYHSISFHFPTHGKQSSFSFFSSHEGPSVCTWILGHLRPPRAFSFTRLQTIPPSRPQVLLLLLRHHNHHFFCF